MNILYDTLEKITDIDSEIKSMMRILEITKETCDSPQNHEIKRQIWIFHKWLEHLRKNVKMLKNLLARHLELK